MSRSTKEKNSDQDIKIAQLEKDIDFIKDVLSDIRKQVSNEIPHRIQALGDKINDFKISNSRLLIGMLTALVLTLVGVILNFFRIVGLGG